MNADCGSFCGYCSSLTSVILPPEITTWTCRLPYWSE